MAATATVATRPRARRIAATAPAMSIWAISQPPNISPFGFASAGMAKVRSAGSRARSGFTSVTSRPQRSPFLCVFVRLRSTLFVATATISGRNLSALPQHPACRNAATLLILSAMGDLFDNLPRKGQSGYSAKDIEVLEGLEPVRRRPGMYIGSTDERAMHHLVAELLDNSMDEAVAGHASRIELELDADGFVTVSDNGRGIPVDPHPKIKGKTALEVAMTMLHAGGKFSDKVYQTSGGLHGVGLSVVNALSDKLTVEVARDRVLWAQDYARGKPQSKLKKVGQAPNRRGTAIRFHSDPDIFGKQTHFQP